MNKKQEEEAGAREYLRRCKVLADGISPEAMKLLRETAHYDMPVFQFRDQKLHPLAQDAHTLTLMAAVRDGERGLVQTVLRMREDAEKDIETIIAEFRKKS